MVRYNILTNELKQMGLLQYYICIICIYANKICVYDIFTLDYMKEIFVYNYVTI